MLKRTIFFILMSASLVFAAIPTSQTRELASKDYIKLEVKGKLVRKDAGFAVEARDVGFEGVNMLVILLRSEDKNRTLDRRLEELNGKTVIAQGRLDCRNLGDEKGVIRLLFYGEENIREAE